MLKSPLLDVNVKAYIKAQEASSPNPEDLSTLIRALDGTMRKHEEVLVRNENRSPNRRPPRSPSPARGVGRSSDWQKRVEAAERATNDADFQRASTESSIDKALFLNGALQQLEGPEGEEYTEFRELPPPPINIAPSSVIPRLKLSKLAASNPRNLLEAASKGLKDG
ncbi:hypothetical protein CYMTET_43079, partial [Cymbomonas tetramitiformis]